MSWLDIIAIIVISARLVNVENTAQRGYSESIEILTDGKRRDWSGAKRKS